MGKKVRKGRCKKNNLQATADEPEEVVRAPHSFIFHRGAVGKHVRALVKDLRNVMEPYTATNLRARKNNNIKDFVSVSGLLHVSHMFIFTQTTISPYLRIIRLPKGPTMTFKIHNYSHSNDVLSSLKKQYAFNNIFLSAPLAIMNGFVGDAPHVKLMLTTFQGMFPTLNVTTVNLKTITRCVLFNFNADTKTIDFRHYVISSTPLGVSKAVKKLGKNKIPDLSRFSDMSEFITKAEVLSDSEFEDDANSHVNLPQTIGRRSLKGNKASVRLTEYGPRLTLQLIKVEEGVMEGEVIFHEYVEKTEKEKEEIKKRMAAQKKLKEKRRREQAQNVKRKAEEKEMLKQKSLAGMKKAENVPGDQQEKANDDDDDAEWFRKEVGQEPEPELFQANQRKSILKRKSNYESNVPKKKAKFSDNSKRITWSNDVKPPNKDFQKRAGKKPKSRPVKKVISSKVRQKKKHLGTRVKKGKRH